MNILTTIAADQILFCLANTENDIKTGFTQFINYRVIALFVIRVNI